MELLPSTEWNTVLNERFDVVGQKLYIGGFLIGTGKVREIKRKIGDAHEYSNENIEISHFKDIMKINVSLKLIWSNANRTKTHVSEALDQHNQICSYPELQTEDWICNETHKVISFHQVCDGKYDCSKDGSDTSDENNAFCKIVPSFLSHSG